MPAQRQWREIPISGKLFQNVDETVLTQTQAAIENAFQNEAGGHTRFPGIKPFVDIGAVCTHSESVVGPVYLDEWRGDMMAATSLGRLYRVDNIGNIEDVTGVPISGDGRVLFAHTDQELILAAGGPMLRFAGDKTEVLSADAPESTHVGYLASFVLAFERGTVRWRRSDSGQARIWDPLSVFSADAKPDIITALHVTDFAELLIAGDQSIEQWERSATGEEPFFRRWAAGEGVLAPYTMVDADNGTFLLNKEREFIRLAGQTGQAVSDDLGASFKKVPHEKLDGAWAARIEIAGQKFVLLQIPQAPTPYGTEGLTSLYDYRQRRWCQLFGWDDALDVPTLWPGTSYLSIWGRHFVGTQEGIGELDTDTFSNLGAPQRMYFRTSHYDGLGQDAEITNVRMRLKRGMTPGITTDPLINLRCLKDNSRRTKWVRRSLGRTGERQLYIEFGPIGNADTFQFEVYVQDPVPVEIMRLEVQVA